MRNTAVIIHNLQANVRRLLTLIAVAVVVLMVLPMQQVFAQESDSIETPAEGVEIASDGRETPTSKVEVSEVEEAGDSFDGNAEEVWPAEGITLTEDAVPEEILETGGQIVSQIEGEEGAPGIAEIDAKNESIFGVPSLRSAFNMFARSADYYNPTPSPGVQNFWASRNRVENPQVAQRCGLNVALVFDVSNSIGATGLERSKQAGYAVVDALSGAEGTKLGIFNFETYANSMNPSIDMATQPQVARWTIDELSIAPNGKGGTNWEGGIQQINNSNQKYDVVYFITDGVPTANNSLQPSTDYGFNTNNQDIYKAIDQANILKANGTRLEVLAVGMDDSEVNVFKDDVFLATSDSLPALGNFNRSNTLNTSNPEFRWNTVNGNWIDEAVRAGILIENGNHKALAGADVTAQLTNQWHSVRIGGLLFGTTYYLPRYELDRPTGRQIALSLTSDVTEVSNYDLLEQELINMLPAPCIANVAVEKSVVNSLGEPDHNASVAGWEFEMGKRPAGFTFQDGYQAKAVTNTQGRAEWRFKTDTPTASGNVDITELLPTNLDAAMHEVVCRDRQDAEIPVEVNGQKFSIKLAAGQNYTCEVTNKTPGFEVSKRAAADQNPDVEGDQPVAGVKADGSFKAFYHIDVQNLSKSRNTMTKPVVDTLVYPQGFTANEVIFTHNGNRIIATKRNGSYELPVTTFGAFNANETKTINVEVRGTATEAAQAMLADGTVGSCEASVGTSNGGLLNKVSMEGDGDKTNNEACVDVNALDILLKLLKVDHNDVAQALGGAEFALHAASNGQIGEKIADFTAGGNDGSHEARVAVGGEYFIVETRAPDGFSLLPAPVHIRVGMGTNGQMTVEVLNPNEAFSATPKASDDPKYVIMQVADLQSGALPESGGKGVLPFAIVALMIMGFGAMMLRRKA